jgi:hypothetical protein
MNKLLVAFFFAMLYCLSGIAQGCSDAGFCTAGAMKAGGSGIDSAGRKTNTGMALSFGVGEKSTAIYSVQLETRIRVNAKSSIEVRVPINYADGNLGSYTGLGDPIVTYNRKVGGENRRDALQATAGVRVGTSNADATSKGVMLPMPYQSSLGTTDLIVGLHVKVWKYLNVAAGYQQPIIQYNNNGYLPDFVYATGDDEHLYFASNKLVRKGDVLLRLDGHYTFRKMTLGFGPLLIYHLAEDEFTNAFGSKEFLKGSEGLTLNLAANAVYDGNKSRVELSAGSPMIVREYRPDGLTRAVVVTLRYTRLNW